MCVPIQEVDSDIAPVELATMLDQPLLVRFRDSGCIVGFSASRGKVMGVAPNDQLDLIADTASVDTASTILFWAQEWAEFRSRQVSLR